MGCARPDHGASRGRAGRRHSQNGDGCRLGRRMDEHDTTVLGVATFGDCRIKGAGHYGVLCDGAPVEFCRHCGRLFRILTNERSSNQCMKVYSVIMVS